MKMKIWIDSIEVSYEDEQHDDLRDNYKEIKLLWPVDLGEYDTVDDVINALDILTQETGMSTRASEECMLENKGFLKAKLEEI